MTEAFIDVDSPIDYAFGASQKVRLLEGEGVSPQGIGLAEYAVQ